jgi:sensor domain CHASE-containing protein
MSLRGRTLLIVSLLMLATLATVQLANLWLVYPSFLALEQEQARRNAEQVIEVIDRELALLAPTCKDWAYWDETYQFAADRNDTYARTNLDAASQLSLKVNLLAFYDIEGKRLWARGVDFDSKMSFPLDEFSRDRLPADYPLLARNDTPTVRFGLLNTSHGPMLAVSTPILRSDHSGPRRGTLIMGRFLDTEAVKRISRQTLLHIGLRQTTSTEAIRINPDVTSQRLAHTDFKFETATGTIRATTTLASMEGKPLLDLSIDTPREISASGRAALRLSTISIALAGLAITLVLLWLLNRSIVVPVSRLTRLVRRIGADEDNHTRLQLNRNDEIGELGNEFDRMLDRIADARRRLLNESYRAGANEMAGGVINDLREALGPLRERLEQPLRLLDRSQTAAHQPLLHELNDPATSRHRQSEIIQVLQDHSHENAGLVAEARSELRGIRKGLENLQGIVAEYSRFIASSSTAEAVPVGDLIQHAVRKMPVETQLALDVEVDSSVERVPPALAAREILQQVVNVLIDQSAKSRGAKPQARRQLRITASTEFYQGRSMLHFRFDDDRAALTGEEISGLFNRELHVGDDSHGLGLPWAENAILAMGGRLYAEAARPYDGLVLHLLLVRAKNVDM